MSYTFYELMVHMENRAVINTHSHHREDETFESFDLNRVLDDSYISWCGERFDKTYKARKDYLKKVGYKSYFVWLQKSIQQIYNLNEKITVDNWDIISGKVCEAYKSNGHNIELLKDKCHYEKIILDAFWDPGSNNNHPELFTPTFRINMFLFGYSKEAKDHNGNNPLKLYNTDINDIDEYIAFTKSTIARKKDEGCVALKSALAYDRGLDFTEVSKDRAQKAFGRTGYVVTDEDIKAFQDYVFFEICKIAAELDIPLQCHTGLGILKKTNAMQMQELIAKNPKTKFVLFHGSYPWTSDIGALFHTYRNVYPDLCWLPLISMTVSEKLLHELIEVGLSDRVCWGCDTWTAEESYGALLAMRRVLATVLSDKVDNGYISLEDARVIIDNILYNNAKKLYKLK